MRALLLLALAAALAVGCSKPEDTTTTSTTGTTGSAPKATTTGTGTAATGKFAAVQTIFNANCVKCHSGPNPKQGIDLSSYDTAMKGGSEGAVIKAGDPTGSKLVMALHGKGAKQMPPPGALPAADIATVEAWIKDGAKNG